MATALAPDTLEGRVQLKGPGRDPSDLPPRERIDPRYYAVLWRPDRLVDNLRMLYLRGHTEGVPNLWQVFQGTWFYWYRYFFRSGTVGLDTQHQVRDTFLAKMLQNKALRTPVLFAWGATGPRLDITGLAVPVDYKVRHLIGAYHPGDNAVYDLQYVDCFPGKLEELRDWVVKVLDEDTPGHRFVKDLNIYEHYHERLLWQVQEALEGRFSVAAENAHNPDTSTTVHVRWCLNAPATPEETAEAIAQGTYNFEPYA